MDDNYPPYVFRDSSGSIQGILPDEWHLWEKYTGIPVKIIATDWALAQVMLARGKAQVIDTIFRTPERARIYDFSEPYATIPVSIFFEKTIISIPDTVSLRGFAVAVKKGDACIEILRKKGISSFIFYPSYESIILAASAGTIKVFCMDDPPALYLLRKYKIAGNFRKGFVVYTGQFHRAVRKGNRKLLAEIENGFSKIPKGKLEQVREKWLGVALGEPFYYRYIPWLLLISGILAVFIAIWTFMLRKAVREKTRDLQAVLEETKKKEELLRETKEHLELALQGAALGTWYWDIEAQKVIRSPRYAEMLGYLPDELETDPGFWVNNLHPEDRKRVLKSVREHLAGKTHLYEEEYRMRHKSGTWIWILDKGKVISRDETGKPLRMAGVDMDITRRKRMETTLRLLNLAIEQNPASIMITNPEGTIEYVNPKFCKLTGYESEEIIGRNPRILKSGKTTQDTYKELWDTITSGSQWHGVLCNKKKNGDFYWEDTIICPIFDESGKISHFLALKEDITERKLLEKQLVQAQRLESIGRLAGGIAHDFNNVLSVIIGNAQLILSDHLDKDLIHESCRDILNAGIRSKNLVNQLLAFARKQTIKPEVLNLNEVINESKTILQRLVGEDVEVQFVEGKDLWNVKIDPSQIHQILTNLAINSRDAIPNVGKITIETRNFVPDESFCRQFSYFKQGEYVMLTFRDTGSGMDKETLEHIFEPFFTTKEPGKGTGLGLATVYGIVKQNGGFINVYSELGRGTTFNIWLPRYIGDKGKNEEFCQEKAREGNETILVIDDEETILRVCERVLKKLGYRVISSRSPSEAIRLCKEEKGYIHLMLTDVVMPSMNGKELREQIEKIKPGIKTLFMSGYASEIISKKGILVEGINYIEKPFSHEELAEKVRTILDKQ